MMRVSKVAAPILFAMTSLIAVQAVAAPIYTDNFNGFSQGTRDAQADTGLTIGAWGSLSNWSASGTNVLHAVQQATNNWAIMLYDTNAMVMNSGIAANANGVSYTVSFDAAAAIYMDRGQGTAAGDKIHFDILNSSNAVVSSFDYATPSWTGNATNPFQAASFTYTGNGSGDVRLRIADYQENNRFAGAIDNLSISATSTNVPEPASMMLLLGGLGGIAYTRRRKANQA